MTALAYDEAMSAVAGQDGSGLLSQDGHALPAKFHPLAQLFPMIEGEAFAALVQDVRANGVRRPIVLFEGMILDGRNRYMAARDAGVGYPVVDFTGEDPVAFVVSENIHRRHLTETQRSMVAGRIAKMPKGYRSDIEPRANLREVAPTSRSQAAEMLNVSERSVTNAKAVIEHGAARLVAAVDAGTVSVSAAAEVAKLPEDIQVEVAAAGPDAVRETAKTIREDSTVLERLDAGDPETVAQVRAEIIEAVSAPRPRTSRANPNHVPNPAFDTANRLMGGCDEIVAAVKAGPAVVIRGCLDNLMRANAIAKVKAAQAALETMMEAFDEN